MDIKDMEFRQLTKVRFDGCQDMVCRLPSYVLKAAKCRFVGRMFITSFFTFYFSLFTLKSSSYVTMGG